MEWGGESCPATSHTIFYFDRLRFLEHVHPKSPLPLLDMLFFAIFPISCITCFQEEPTRWKQTNHVTRLMLLMLWVCVAWLCVCRYRVQVSVWICWTTKGVEQMTNTRETDAGKVGGLYMVERLHSWTGSNQTIAIWCVDSVSRVLINILLKYRSPTLFR